MSPPPDISVVVPVYGGATTIEALAERVDATMSARGWSYELIFVCDRPRDGSWEVARRLAASGACVRALLLRRNFGQHPATLLGIREARGETIVTMDEDLQHSPEDIPLLVETSRAMSGIAYGIAEELQHAWWRNVTSRTAKWLVARYVGFDARDVSAFRAFPATLRAAFADYRGERVAIDVLLSWAGAPARAVRCAFAPRAGGESGYTLRKLVAYLGDLLLGYSTAPLRLASWLGLVAVVAAIAIGAYVLANWFVHGSAVPGFAFLALSVAAFSGAQLLALGLIGEYLGRLYFNSLQKPQYLVEASVSFGADSVNGRDSATPSAGSPAAAPE
ncbi:MAG: glycosyltransferase family 2 protein [Myxococcales bacterium]|nr:glycosyltransferase family 2 protein [Myxococcales bacterium]MCB9519967.1 glycosyltransferase family 2 protein [Myxococcales bacterium]MCB9532514.1 glycosyltransferase family 2 protein [Myxococcales bacterium]MCB9533122.1 glycosyltransferase family 2 protein [Myxococcales bacterium]